MQFKTIATVFIPMLFAVMLLIACDKKSSKDKKGNDTTQIQTENIVNVGKEVEAFYQDCTVYTGSTIFFFKTSMGDTLQVSILNKGMEEAEKSAKVPENLVDDSEDIEGVPGANPKMVGKKFKLIYNAKNDEIIEVKPME